MKIKYIEKRFAEATLDVINTANDIIEEYQAEDLNLTLRQLYYQFVSRDLLPNKQSEYKRLGSIISDSRMAGLTDWYAIEDRTRNLKSYYHNEDPAQAIQDALDQFKLNKWEYQPYYVEVWIEKEALVGVISTICQKLDVPYFACKGYNSQSEMWRAARRMHYKIDCGQKPVIVHLGDHDPSGIDMTRDIIDRNELFIGEEITVERIALNYDQIEEYEPPPNPSKFSDPRAKNYIEKYGTSSWELDALNPKVIRQLISDTVDKYTDQSLLDDALEQEQEDIVVLEKIIKNLNL